MADDICKVCGMEMRVVTAYNTVDTGGPPENPIRLFRVVQVACRNPQCPEHGKTVEIRTEQPLGVAPEEKTEDSAE